MKLFISCDIEGVAGISHWAETEPGNKDQLYSYFKKQMTREVSAACRGAMSAGATDILVKDAHDSARNLILDELPKQVSVNRGWAGDVLSMISGIDKSFDALAYVGYHAPGHDSGNPLSHTMTTAADEVRINGKRASEFMIHAYAGAYFGVPSVFISGDEGICNHAQELVPGITAYATKRGVGNSVTSKHPELTVEEIEAAMHGAVKNGFSDCLITLPQEFEATVKYAKHPTAYSKSQYPGARLLDEKTISFTSNDYLEVMRFFHFVL